MSASDRVRITYKKEITLGSLATGDLGTTRILSDSLSGTMRTIPTDEVTGDRQSTGQDVVGMDIDGGFSVKLSPDTFHDDMLEAAMMDAWSSQVAEAADITIDATAGTLTKTGGTDFTTIFTAGEMLTLSGFSTAANNCVVYVANVASDVLTVLLPDDAVDEVGSGTSVALDPYVEIGTDEISYSFIKEFQDLTTKAITYLGERCAGFDFSFTFGEHVTGNYNFAGTGWQAPATPDSDGRTVTPITSEGLLNASQDVGLVVLDGVKVDFCIKTLGVTLDNGLNPKECIGHLAPTDQIPSDADVQITMEAYLADTNFDMVQNKMENTPVSIAYYALNSTGKGYAFQIPSVQLSFPDPANEGKGTQSMLNMSGLARKDTTFGNTLRIYKVDAS